MTRRQPIFTRLVDDVRIVGLFLLGVSLVVLIVTSRAQNGLPWQRTYDITASVPDAGKLTKNADVRIGGARVGQVLEIRAMPSKGGEPPRADLKIQMREGGPLPVDSTVEVRLASVLGGKYVSIVPGKSRRTVKAGGRLPLANARASVDLDEAFKAFDPAGRRGVRTVINELGTALSGRGGDLNEAFAATVRALPPAQNVLRNLAAAETDLPGFVRGAAAATSALVPVAAEITPLLDRGSTTLEALDSVRDELGATIEAIPPTTTDARDALRTLRPVLADVTDIAQELRPAARSLTPSARNLSRAARTAIRVDPEVATVAKPLGEVLDGVRDFTGNPASSNSLRLLGTNDLATFGASAFVGLGAILREAWEAERNCFVATNWVKGLNEALSEGDAGGNWLRMIPIFRLSEMLPADKPTEGLHYNPYPQQNDAECEAGNEPMTSQETTIGPLPGLQLPQLPR